MTDYLGYVLQGLFTGVGVSVANYFSDRHIKTRLEAIENNFKKAVRGDENGR